MLIVLAGFPEPEVNMIIRHDDGEWSVRLDLCYPHLKLIIEYGASSTCSTHSNGAVTSSDGTGWSAGVGELS